MSLSVCHNRDFAIAKCTLILYSKLGTVHVCLYQFLCLYPGTVRTVVLFQKTSLNPRNNSVNDKWTSLSRISRCHRTLHQLLLYSPYRKMLIQISSKERFLIQHVTMQKLCAQIKATLINSSPSSFCKRTKRQRPFYRTAWPGWS